MDEQNTLNYICGCGLTMQEATEAFYDVFKEVPVPDFFDLQYLISEDEMRGAKRKIKRAKLSMIL